MLERQPANIEEKRHLLAGCVSQTVQYVANVDDGDSSTNVLIMLICGKEALLYSTGHLDCLFCSKSRSISTNPSQTRLQVGQMWKAATEAASKNTEKRKLAGVSVVLWRHCVHDVELFAIVPRCSVFEWEQRQDVWCCPGEGNHPYWASSIQWFFFGVRCVLAVPLMHVGHHQVSPVTCLCFA